MVGSRARSTSADDRYYVCRVVFRSVWTRLPEFGRVKVTAPDEPHAAIKALEALTREHVMVDKVEIYDHTGTGKPLAVYGRPPLREDDVSKLRRVDVPGAGRTPGRYNGSGMLSLFLDKDAWELSLADEHAYNREQYGYRDDDD